MARNGANELLSSYDDIFSTQASRDLQDSLQEEVRRIPISELHPFEGHPFRVTDDAPMQQMAESVAEYGVMTPLLVRTDPDGGYEIISGHRRLHAAELAGMETLPVIVREMDDDEAIITMVDANLQREDILPSERAWAYKMKLDAIKHQGSRSDLTSAQVAQKSSVQRIGDDAGVSKDTVRRLIRLTELNPKLMDMVDEKKIGINPAVELSYLGRDEQEGLLEAMEYAQATPSLSQAHRLRKMSQEGTCSVEAMCEIMKEVKKEEPIRLVFKADVLHKYFPQTFTSSQMESTILHLLDQWKRKRDRQQSR